MTKPRKHGDCLDYGDEIVEMDYVIMMNIWTHHTSLGPISELRRLFRTHFFCITKHPLLRFNFPLILFCFEVLWCRTLQLEIATKSELEPHVSKWWEHASFLSKILWYSFASNHEWTNLACLVHIYWMPLCIERLREDHKIGLHCASSTNRYLNKAMLEKNHPWQSLALYHR